MVRMVQEGDGRAIYQGLRCLSAGNVGAIDKMILGRVTGDAIALIMSALTAGLPETDDQKKAEPGATTPSPGNDTDSLPMAS